MNNIKRKIYLTLKSLSRPLEFYTSFLNMFATDVYKTNEHLELAADWLLKSQKNSQDGNGYSRGYYLYKTIPWDKGYVETTGYIIPSLIEAYNVLGKNKYKRSAIDAGLWLLSKQNKNGSFSSIDNGIELVFDTGQVLYGLNYLATFNELDDTKRDLFKKAAIKAAEWLVEVQDEDGCWRHGAFNDLPHTYYTRVASALYETGLIVNNNDFCNHALRNIYWSMGQLNQDSFFEHLRFTKDNPAYLHTMIYVLEGLIEVYINNKDEKILECVLKNAEVLKYKNLNETILLGSQYDESFQNVNSERCITGIAQWANICLSLYRITEEEEYKQLAIINLHYLKSKQLKKGDNIKGAFCGSNPIWGSYSPYAFNNWPVKFFIDGLIQYLDLNISEQEESTQWTIHSFNLAKSNKINDQLSKVSEFYISNIIKALKGKIVKGMDIGAGNGIIIRRLNKEANLSFIGVDPVICNDIVQYGDCYYLPNDRYDSIITLETLQHVRFLNMALRGFNERLNVNGDLFIGDRNICSVKFFIKVLMELKSKWMYPYDSPFHEKWYTKTYWKKTLECHGFKVVSIKTYTSKGYRFSFFNRYILIHAKKVD